MPRRNAEATERFFSGPLRWSELPPNLEARAGRCFTVAGSTFCQPSSNGRPAFAAKNRRRAKSRWETIDAAFRDYFSGRELTPELAADVAYDLLSISLGMAKDEPLFNELRVRYAGK